VICTLCRRQFTSPELLQRHEKESKLHAENLAKLKATTQESESVVYRDRASERRAIHGQSEIPEDLVDPAYRPDEIFTSQGRKRRAGSISDLMVDHPHPSVVPASPLPAPSPILSEDIANPGNQLLRLMGWSEGQGLGKDATGRVESIAESVTATSRVQSTAGVGIATPLPSSSNTSNFKSSLKQRTIARYEQINK
jgi:RNA-binding protein 5/10